MKPKRIYLTVYDNIDDKTALIYAAELIKELPERKGVVKWKGGLCAGFSDYSKCTAIQVWEDKNK